MNKVIGMLAVVVFASSMASAELLKNFKYDGVVEVNAFTTNNSADFNKKADDKTGFTDVRVMLNAGFDLNEDVNAVVSAVKCNNQYGTNAAGTGEKSITVGLDSFTFDQAYLNLKGVIGIDHKLGRQYYGEAGDLIIYYGPKMWPYTSKFSTNGGIDGWTGWYKTGKWDFNAIIANEQQVAATGKQNINIYGFNAMTKVADIDMHGYVYSKNDKTGGTSDYLDVLGVKAKYAVAAVKGLDVAAEYAMNMGKDLNMLALGYKHQGYAYKVNANYSMDLAGKLGLMGEYVFASGDEKNNTADTAFEGIKGDYRPGIIMGGGFSAANTGSGAVYTILGANWTPSKLEKLNVAATYYDFSADKKSALTKKHIGTETDLVATWTHSNNVNLKGYYSMLQPEKKNVTVVNNDDAQTMMGAAICVKF